MSNVEKYARERKDDLLPRSMKALDFTVSHNWAGWLQEEFTQHRVTEDGTFVLMADRSRAPDMDARNALCADCVEWFRQHGLEVAPTHPELDKTNDRYAEITFRILAPEAEKTKKLASLMKTLVEEMEEQARIDAHYVTRAG